MLWVYKLHERVNLKLGYTYNVKFDEVKDRLESFRAKCTKGKKTCAMPLNLKANSFTKAEHKNAPVIDPKFYHHFKSYAKIRGVEFKDELLDLLNRPHTDKAWFARDLYCTKLIKKMRIKGIPSVEPEGEFKNLPTRSELNLMKMLSTNICCEELEEISKMIDEKKYLF